MANPEIVGHNAIGYWASARTIQISTYRLTINKSGEVELYDHTTVQNESRNIAEERPELVEEVRKLLAPDDTKCSVDIS